MADTTKMLPIKKLADVGGNYYPLTTTETVVFAQDCEVVNNIGAYRAGDKIYIGTSVKTVLENILGRPIAFNIITTTFDKVDDKTAPSSLLTKTEFDKKEKEIQENKTEIEDIKTDISQKFEKMNKTFDTEDNKYIKGFTQVDGELTEIREETLPDKSKVSIETIKLDGGISAILTIDGVAHNIYVPNVDNEFGDEPSTENAASSKLVKDSLDTKQDTIVWRNDNYDKDRNKAITESDLNASLYKVCHQRGEFASPDSVYDPVDGDIISCGNYYYIYSKERNKWLQLNQNNDYPVKGTITGDHIVVDSIQQDRIKGLTNDIDICKAKSTVKIDNTLSTGTPIATIKINDVPTIIKAPSIETCVTTSVTSSNHEEVVIFSNDKGNVIKSSGKTLGISVPSNAVFTDTTYSLTDKEIEILKKLEKERKGYLVSERQCDEIDKVDGINTTVSDHTKSIEKLGKTVDTHADSISTNSTNIEDLKSKVKVNAEAIELRETIEQHNTDHNNLVSRVDTLSDSVTSLNETVTEAVETVNKFDSRISSNTSSITNLYDIKQNKLTFITEFDADFNKVATQKDIEKLSGTTYFLGISTTEITDGGKEQPTIGGIVIEPENGDIALYKNYEFIWSDKLNGGSWARFGAAGEFILKNAKAVTNEDVADGALSISKISGLQDALDSKSNASDVVTISDEQIITGEKTFSAYLNVSQLVYDSSLVIYWRDSTGALREMMRFENDIINMTGTYNTSSNPIQGYFEHVNYS